ncbi:RNA-binding E3 ubiquitin-protein ligase MEX3C-like isoform X3 [Aphelocoma coerulescens]|uniref:RNA-binding E3 ubiquitin-protein ligase MEX3C-like isoform X3 n=1 Tax=Aphelocoma coerulescens TaxID=39617 RepID=UPI003604B5DF
MPSSSAAAASRTAELPRLPPHPLPLLQQHISGLGFRDHGLPAGGSRVAGVARKRAGLLPPPDSLGEPRLGGAGEAAARDEGDLELEEEEEDEEDHLAALLLLSTTSSPSQPLPLLPALGSVLLSSALDEQEAAAGAHDPEDMMAAMLSHAYGSGLSGGGAVGLSGEGTALLRGKSVNTTECVPVPSSEHVAEIVGRQASDVWPLTGKQGFSMCSSCSRRQTLEKCPSSAPAWAPFHGRQSFMNFSNVCNVMLCRPAAVGLVVLPSSVSVRLQNKSTKGQDKYLH